MVELEKKVREGEKTEGGGGGGGKEVRGGRKLRDREGGMGGREGERELGRREILLIAHVMQYSQQLQSQP